MSSRRRLFAAARRRAAARLSAPRAWLMKRLFIRRRAGRTARLRYAAVLDGQTVNLHAELPKSIAEADEAEIVILRGRRRYQLPARVYEDRDGLLLMDAAVLLGTETGGVPITPGRWKLRLRVHSGRRTRQVPLLLAELTTPRTGVTGPMTSSPVTADRYRLGRTVRGDARVVCAKAKPAAEVINVHIEHARIEVDLRVLGVRAEAPWAEFVAAGRNVTRSLDEVEPGVWRVEVPLADMLPSGGRREHWDVMVHTDAGARLRLGRRLHDVQAPGRVFAMRKILVSPRRDTLMRIEPRYTPAGSLRFTCSDGAGVE
ncbi:hypothetical protein ACFOZ0_15890 [Streptomyces yaanensis]|uniref:Uncharacterized protein n=1 Tax=Streptomyces yaanensis TaxID=1142239 RepID=A0ABV7SEP5_9ACTN|nr:hypothetical protein [Streptomyces sp. CGMCC 4.7035]WNB98451.1 hypothetical protein Q2K21_10410 [Streptomyces sp. CGMCC 4.7035]